MGNQALNNYNRDASDVDEKISLLLSDLPRVEAPGDFAFRVKAKIAERRPVRGGLVWLPTAAKAALPLILLFVGVYFGLTAFYGTPETQPVAREAAPAPVVITPAAAATPAEVFTADVAETPIEAPLKEHAAAGKSRRVKRAQKKVSDDVKGSGSYDITAPITKELLPEGSENDRQAGKVLTRIGVIALFGEDGWKAASISPNSAAERAGIKAGDVIEALDGQTLNDLSSVTKPAVGKKVRVLREGKSIEIAIDP